MIGIDAYQKAPRLGYAAADAKSVAALLPALGFPKEHIRLLIDGAATKAGIETTLYRELASMMGPNDRLLVYFAGHGETLRIREWEEGYILPVDADLAALPLTAILMNDVQRIARRLPAKHYLFVMDACFSGFATTRAAEAKTTNSQDFLAAALRAPVVEVITAGRKGERSIEDQGHGLFTRYLLDGLGGHADQEGLGYFSAAQLATWLQSRVVRESNGRMNPQYARVDGEGRFMVTVPGSQLRAAAPDLSGTFTGIMQGKSGEREASQHATVTFVQKGNNLTGTYTSGTDSGTLTGYVDVANIRAFRLYQDTPCKVQMHGTAVAANNRNAVTGSVEARGCDGRPFIVTFRLGRVDRERRFDDSPRALPDLVNIGHSYFSQRRYEEALDYFNQARRAAEQRKDEAVRLDMLLLIGVVHGRLGQTADSVDYFEQAVRVAEEVGEPKIAAQALGILGHQHLTENRLSEARRDLEKSLAVAERAGDEAQQARALHSLGLVAAREGRRSDALPAFEKALQIAERLKLPDGPVIRRDRDSVLSQGR